MENEDNEINRIQEEAELREIFEAELEFSMRTAYDTICSMGLDQWILKTPINSDRKKTILRNMVKWYEIREEYERCSYLQKGIEIINNQ